MASRLLPIGALLWLGPAGTGLFVVFNEGRATGEFSGLVDRALAIKFTRPFEIGR